MIVKVLYKLTAIEVYDEKNGSSLSIDRTGVDEAMDYVRAVHHCSKESNECKRIKATICFDSKVIEEVFYPDREKFEKSNSNIAEFSVVQQRRDLSYSVIDPESYRWSRRAVCMQEAVDTILMTNRYDNSVLLREGNYPQGLRIHVEILCHDKKNLSQTSLLEFMRF